MSVEKWFMLVIVSFYTPVYILLIGMYFSGFIKNIIKFLKVNPATTTWLDIRDIAYDATWIFVLVSGLVVNIASNSYSDTTKLYSHTFNDFAIFCCMLNNIYGSNVNLFSPMSKKAFHLFSTDGMFHVALIIVVICSVSFLTYDVIQIINII